MDIIFDCATGGPPYLWTDCSIEDGIGGSEQCVILLARELAALGHKVTVFNNCGEWAGVYNGVEYKHHTEFRPTVDLYVSWRNWHLCQGRLDRKRWVWCHDIPVGVHCPTQQEVRDGALNYIDKFVVLNKYHQGIYMDAGIPEDYTLVAPIGVAQETFDVDVERDPARVLYFSHPDRGLDVLRAMWPEIHSRVPEATLASFWWEPSHYRQPMPHLGILPMSRLNYKQVSQECLRAGVFGYPCIFSPEISPATTILAQFGGAIPVVVEQGGMVDTVKFGVKTSMGMFTNELISALKMSIAGDLEDERIKMMKWARDTYSWRNVAKVWEKEMNNESYV